MKQPSYKFRAKVWVYPGEAGWHFVNVSKKQSREIKKEFGELARGWGSLPVRVTVGNTNWKTSIFPDTKSNSYLLPIKSEVRKKEDITAGMSASLTIEILV